MSDNIVGRANYTQTDKNMDDLNLTELERSALWALAVEHYLNGNDFGVIESVDWSDRKQLGGLITSLNKRGVFEEIYYPYIVNEDRVTQYKLKTKYCISRTK